MKAFKNNADKLNYFNFAAVGGSSDDFGDNDPTELHGLQGILDGCFGVPKFAIQAAREQIGRQTGEDINDD